MNREETLGIMSVLKAAYPAYYRGMTRQEAERVVGLWQELFTDDSAAAVGMAVKAYIASDEKGFPPHIGAIKTAIRALPRSADRWAEKPDRAWLEQVKRYEALRAQKGAERLTDDELRWALEGGPEHEPRTAIREGH